MKGYPLKDIYAALGHTKVINSVLVPIVGEEIMLARIIDEEREYHCEGSTSDTWNHWLNVKQKKIFWKELYDLDVAARVFKKKKDKEKVTFLEDSSSKSGLESLKALEEKILGAMSEGFSGLKSVVEAKLGDMDVRMSKFEKNQRQLRRRAKKIEEKLTSIESNKNEERNYVRRLRKTRKTVRRLRKTRKTVSLARKRMWSRVGKTVRMVRKKTMRRVKKRKTKNLKKTKKTVTLLRKAKNTWRNQMEKVLC
ncbi:BnaCnng46060D [Brassica napus]|uniref:BnaCnng46060D protein n=1 Tax=Brassica napus TaxID=3708 RepID=A0A078JC63_BRANA|nr:BnaCnng46060D [Brassica napus]